MVALLLGLWHYSQELLRFRTHGVGHGVGHEAAMVDLLVYQVKRKSHEGIRKALNAECGAWQHFRARPERASSSPLRLHVAYIVSGGTGGSIPEHVAYEVVRTRRQCRRLVLLPRCLKRLMLHMCSFAICIAETGDHLLQAECRSGEEWSSVKVVPWQSKRPATGFVNWLGASCIRVS